MKLDRAKNTSRNIVFGIILKIYTILVPFAIRTIMIYSLGMEYIGLNGLFTSILQVLNMTELGVGIAMVFSMYKPIAHDDTNTICALMQLYKKYYRIIGSVIGGIGLLLTPFIPKLISGDVPADMNIYILYLLNLGCTVLSYWLFAYKNSILSAHQRNDVLSKITLSTNSVQYILQIIVLLVLENYYAFIIIALLGQILTNIVTAIVSNKIYPDYQAKGKLEKKQIKEINQRIRDLFTAKIGATIQNSFDFIIISAFLGLTVLAKYNNYYFIMNSVFGFICILFASILAGVGNSVVLDSKEKNYNDFKKLMFITNWLAIFCSICLLCLYQPFIKLWIGEENTLPFGIVICLALYLFTMTTNQALCVYKDGAGVWHSDRFRPLISSLTNLVLNLITVKFLGLYGVVLSTVVSVFFIGMPWMIRNIFKEIFKKSPTEYVKRFIVNIVTLVIAGISTYLLCSIIPVTGLLELAIKLVICMIVPNLVLIIMNFKTQEFAYVVGIVKKKLNR